MRKHFRRYAAIGISIGLAMSMTACGNSNSDTASESTVSESTDSEATTAEMEDTSDTAEATETEVTGTAETTLTAVAGPTSVETTDTIDNSGDGEHAIEVDGEEASYTATAVTKTGDSSQNDEADFYGDNAAIFATNGATLTLSNMDISTDGKHANAVFSYGEGTTVNISDSIINTSADNSGGLMTTGGGTMNATNLTIHTTGNSSAAIRSDRGGGTVVCEGGTYTTDGTGSPVIYSTADITVNNSYLTSTASQGIVVEGKNSTTLNGCVVDADNNTKNSDNSDYYQAVMIYQSMSGDADSGDAYFAMNGGSLENRNGDIFFVTNTVAEIDLTNAAITNDDADGIFLRASAAGWGSEGSNGGNVTLNASNQAIDGDMLVDSVSTLNLYLKDGSTFTGAINTDGQDGDVYVEIEDGSTWILTGDTYITSLTCGADAINLNGYTLYVNGTAYTEGTESTGEAVEAVANTSSGSGDMQAPPDGNGGGSGDMQTPPDGNGTGNGAGSGDGSTPPEKPDGDGAGSDNGAGDGSTPPAKPGEN